MIEIERVSVAIDYAVLRSIPIANVVRRAAEETNFVKGPLKSRREDRHIIFYRAHKENNV